MATSCTSASRIRLRSVIAAKERVKKLAAASVVMAGLYPAIQFHTEFIGFFMDGPVKPGHDKLSLLSAR